MSPTSLSRVEEGVRAVSGFIEAWNRRDLPGMARLLADDCVFEADSPLPDGTALRGKAAVLSYIERLMAASPGTSMRVEELLGFGRRCVARYRLESAGGESARYADLYAVSGGLIRERLSYTKRP